MALNVLTLSTLFPDATRPNFGVFVERQTRELVSRDGVTVTVLAPVGLPPFPLDRMAHYRHLRRLPLREQWRGIDLYRPRFSVLPATGGALHVAAMTRAILPLVRRLHDERPFDVIDASFFFPDGPVARNLSSALGIPYSVKARGADVHYWGTQPLTAGAVRAAGRDAAGLLAVSAAMRQTMIDLGMAEDRIRVHYTGVDLDRFRLTDRAEAKARMGLSGPVVLATGALIERKGQDLLVRALPALPDVTLLLAGEGPMRAALLRLADDGGVSDRLRLLGPVPHADLPALYAAADVMALPSASEGLANAWVEAIACGTPVLTCDVGGARELIDGVAAGLIVDRTVDAIADGITALLSHPNDPAEVRQAALRFTWAANGDALVDHLQACARGGIGAASPY